MAVTAEDLLAYVNPDQYAGGSTPTPDEFTKGCLDGATALVTQFVGTSTVPGIVLDEAVLEVGSELYNRRKSPNGVAQFGTDGSSPVFTARDPLVRVYALLAPFVPPGLA